MKTLIAIDPGASGGIAIMTHPGADVRAFKTPETPQDLFQIIHRAVTDHGPVKAFVEQVSGFIGEHQTGSSMFNFGRTFGQLEGILIGLRIPFEFSTPQRWQKALALGASGRIRADVKGLSPDQAAAEKKRVKALNYTILRDWKNKLKETAQRLYPQLTVTLSTCDSLLILEYARRLEIGGAPTVAYPPTPQIQTPQLL